MKQKIESLNWRTTLLPLGSTIQQAINCLENSSMQIVLAISENNRLAGTLTDGDIRRAFLKGYSLNSLIDEVINKNPLAVPPEIGRDVILQLMQINKVHQLPIVDHNGIAVGLHVWDTIIEPSPVNNTIVIMAGGKGSRLRPHTENCPKPMLDVGGKPMLEHIINRAFADGFHNFVISVHYLGQMIESYFGDGSKFNVQITYLREDSPLGTAGALSLLSNRPELPFIVTNGDVLTDIHYNEFLDFHNRHEADATMAVRQHEIQNQFGVVQIKGVEIEGFEEKPIYRSHVNAGIYVLDPNVLKHLHHKEYCDMPTLFERVKKDFGKTIVFPMHEPWLDVGRPDDLAAARSSINHQKFNQN